MKLGIVGLPNVGKSTLFNAITNAGAQSANYPFCTIEPNLGVVAVPDERLELLAKLYNTKSVVPATVEFADIAGLVKGASKGEGLGNRFLAHIREVDAVVHVVRCFESSDIVHVEGGVDPLRDIETVNLELIFSDAELVDKKLERTAKAAKADKSAELLLTALKKVKQVLDAGRLAKTAVLSEEESLALSDLNLLTGKPVLYVCNMSEEDFTKGIAENKNYMSVRQRAEAEGSAAVPICAELEAEISSLSGEEKQLFLKEAGIEKGGLDLLIACSYDLLGLMSFLTAGEPEVRAWTIRKGTSAKRAAGKIHSDMERGFIRAEIINYRQLLECGSLTKAREKGLVRSEGKDYIMQEGDVALFRFNV